MQVSQIPLSRVSDESSEGTRPDVGNSMQSDASMPEVSMELEPASMQLDQSATEPTGPGLPELNGSDEPHPSLMDTITCDMSVDSNNEVTENANAKVQPSEEETSYSMELSLDSNTPVKPVIRPACSAQSMQSTQYEAEMDISTVTAASENEPPQAAVQPTVNVPQSDYIAASRASCVISPIPYRKATDSSPFALKNQNTHVLSESINESVTPIPHLNSDLGESSTISKSPVCSPAKTKIDSPKWSPPQAIPKPNDATNAAVLTPMTNLDNQELLLRSSSRRLLCSLPPLRPDATSHHPDERDAKHFKVCHTLIGTREEANRRQQLVGRLGLKVDDRIMSQSLATTPLRQVTPKDWIQATAVQRGDSLSKYGGARRYEPEYLMPSVSRLQGQVMRLASYPVPEYSDIRVGTSLRDLQDFLDRNANVKIDEANISRARSTAEFEQIIQHQLDGTELSEELMNQWQAAQLSNKCRIHVFTNMYRQRQSKVLLQHLLSSTVVKQLDKMSEAERFDFVAQAHERLHQCNRLTLHEFREIDGANVEAVQSEKESIVESVRQLEHDLDTELSSLEAELIHNKTVIKKLRDVSNQLKDRASRLSAIVEETERVKSEFEAVRFTNKQLNDTLADRISQISHDAHDDGYTILPAPGATELFIPWNALTTTGSSSDTEDTQERSAQELSNKFSPADVICLSYDDHIYAVRTLFGLVCVTLTCRPIHSAAPTRSDTTQKPPATTTIKPHKLIIQTVNVGSPPNGLAPVECPAVEAVADFVISLCNSREGRNQFGSKLVGLTLERAVWYIEYVMMPYFLLAGDMRAIFLAGHGVEFECTPPLLADTTCTTPGGQRSLLLSRSTMSLSVAADSTESRSTSMLDRNLSERLNPTGPFNVTVKLCHRDTLTVLLLRFTLPSLESDGIQSPEASITVALGQLSPEKIQRLTEICQVYPGNIYNAVQTVEQSLVNICQA